MNGIFYSPCFKNLRIIPIVKDETVIKFKSICLEKYFKNSLFKVHDKIMRDLLIKVYSLKQNFTVLVAEYIILI